MAKSDKQPFDLPPAPTLGDFRTDPALCAAEATEKGLADRLRQLDAEAARLAAEIKETKERDDRDLRAWCAAQVDALARGLGSLPARPSPTDTAALERQLAALTSERAIFAEAAAKVRAEIPGLKGAAFLSVAQAVLNWSQRFRARALAVLWGLRNALFAEKDAFDALAREAAAAGVELDLASPLFGVRKDLYDRLLAWLVAAVEGNDPLTRDPAVGQLLASGALAEDVRANARARALDAEVMERIRQGTNDTGVASDEEAEKLRRRHPDEITWHLVEIPGSRGMMKLVRVK